MCLSVYCDNHNVYICMSILYLGNNGIKELLPFLAAPPYSLALDEPLIGDSNDELVLAGNNKNENFSKNFEYRLDLRGNDISAEGIVILSGALTSFSRLVSLNLSYVTGWTKNQLGSLGKNI